MHSVSRSWDLVGLEKIRRVSMRVRVGSGDGGGMVWWWVFFMGGGEKKVGGE